MFLHVPQSLLSKATDLTQSRLELPIHSHISSVRLLRCRADVLKEGTDVLQSCALLITLASPPSFPAWHKDHAASVTRLGQCVWSMGPNFTPLISTTFTRSASCPCVGNHRLAGQLSSLRGNVDSIVAWVNFSPHSLARGAIKVGKGEQGYERDASKKDGRV